MVGKRYIFFLVGMLFFSGASCQFWGGGILTSLLWKIPCWVFALKVFEGLECDILRYFTKSDKHVTEKTATITTKVESKNNMMAFWLNKIQNQKKYIYIYIHNYKVTKSMRFLFPTLAVIITLQTPWVVLVIKSTVYKYTHIFDALIYIYTYEYVNIQIYRLSKKVDIYIQIYIYIHSLYQLISHKKKNNGVCDTPQVIAQAAPIINPPLLGSIGDLGNVWSVKECKAVAYILSTHQKRPLKRIRSIL